MDWLYERNLIDSFGMNMEYNFTEVGIVATFVLLSSLLLLRLLRVLFTGFLVVIIPTLSVSSFSRIHIFGNWREKNQKYEKATKW